MTSLTERERRVVLVIAALGALGARAPTVEELRYAYGVVGGNGALLDLARRGVLRSEVYGHNWRVVEVLRGPFAGTRTAAYPGGGPPYRIVDARGSRYVEEWEEFP